jgi:polysaccharide deacetylase 2 family uncharacterized protein YibQ
VGRAKTRRRALGSRGFWIAIVAVTVGATALRIGASDRGQALLVRYGVGGGFTGALATRLDVALARAFLDLGLLRGDVKARVVEDHGRRVREYTFAAPQHRTPTQVQVAIAAAAARVHANVVSAEQRHDQKGELLVRVGFGRRVTHRLVIRDAPAPAVARDARHGPRIALIIDDMGHNLNATSRGFMDLDVPVTLAVLPDQPKSRATFRAATEREIPTLLHLPMEATGGSDPGRGAVRVGMDAEEIDALIGRYHDRYETFVGVNNHMGSRATAHRPTMRALMTALRKRDLVFVDSRTTKSTVGPAAGREAGVWCIANDLFLDDGDEGEEQVAANLRRLAAMARRHGLAVGIAHPHPHTLAALRAALPRLQAEGYEFTTIAGLQPRTAAAAGAGAVEPASRRASR